MKIIKTILLCVIIILLLNPMALSADKTWIKIDKQIQYFLKNCYNIVHIHYHGELHYEQEIIYFKYKNSSLSKDKNLYKCIMDCRTPDNHQTQQCYEINK